MKSVKYTKYIMKISEFFGDFIFKYSLSVFKILFCCFR